MKRYFKICLWSPLWLPVVLGLAAYGLGSLFDGFLNHFPEWILFPAAIIVYSIVFGGLQYCIALYIVWTRIDFECTRSWIVGALWLPIIFAPIQIAGLLLVAGWDLGGIEDFWSFMFIAAYDLALGYGYVLFWFIGLGLIRMFQKLRTVGVE
ncbi:MAG: hypothetical protein NWT02_10570 [Opitutales bacterium]|nr:hypothetical protein [Opitutales bacterium]MDP4643207.1 hypothetical protein [Opitutales bacterium]MDP4777349.1 hypothetical protein [Opitutales bacterium]MDP4883595.1 hypothetical protein [Opitutales bacterium]MDP5079126.1 hypothetical protein [Opitutales bacterium]